MSTSLRTGKLLELCTPSIAYDSQVQAACESFDYQMYEIIDETGQVCFIPNIMGLRDPKLVDILAWQFNVDGYDPTRDLEFRKNLVQQSIIWHKRKGTRALVEEVMHTFWPGGATLEEWFQYRGGASTAHAVASQSPATPTYSTGIVLGIRLQCVVDGKITALRFYRLTPSSTTSRVMKLWREPAHTLVATSQPSVENISQTGWIELPLTPPLDAVAGDIFVASYEQPNGDTYGRTNTASVSESAELAIVTSACWGSAMGGFPASDTPLATFFADVSFVTPSGDWPPGQPDPKWHDRYRFRIMVDQAVIPPDQENAVLALIDRYKPVSRWCEGIFYSRVSECDIGWAGMTLRFIYRESEAPDYP
jgi:hypothetical protein